MTSSKTEIAPSDFSEVDSATANKVATAAVAQGAGVTADTINEIAKSESKNNLMQKFSALSNIKKIGLVGGGLALLGIIIYSTTGSKKTSKI